MTARQARAAKRRKAFARRIGKTFACSAMRVYERMAHDTTRDGYKAFRGGYVRISADRVVRDLSKPPA